MSLLLAKSDLPFDPQWIIWLVIVTFGALMSYLKQKQEAREKTAREGGAKRSPAERREGRLPTAPPGRAGNIPPLESPQRRRGLDRRPAGAGGERGLPELEPVEDRRAPAETRPSFPAGPAARLPGGAPAPLPSGKQAPLPVPPRLRTPADIVEELRRRAERALRAEGQGRAPTAPPAPRVRRAETSGVVVAELVSAPPAFTSPAVTPTAVAPASEPIGAERLRALVANPRQLQVAIVLSEILGPPVSLREGPHWGGRE